jgi:Topoisomerase DNA binding C4 zinc finger/Family of unknown function (DUF6308)
MCEIINVPACDGTVLSLSRCRDKLRCFCEYDAYEDYDAIATCDDVVTRQQFDAVNDAMKANAPLRPWLKFLSPNPVPGLSNVPTDIDMIDSSDDDYIPAKESLRGVYEKLCRDPEIDDMASSKVCYLKRPRLIAISDSYVRGILLGQDAQIAKSDPERGSKLAERGTRVMDETRRVGKSNAELLTRLHDFVLELQIDGARVFLRKGRILDILIWVEIAIRNRHQMWTAWRDGRLDPTIRCPKCGKPMVPRRGTYGEFYGCPRFPKCKGTRK